LDERGWHKGSQNFSCSSAEVSRRGLKPFLFPLPPLSLSSPHAPQYSWPEFIGADLSKVSLKDALARSSFDPRRRTLFVIEVGAGPGRGEGGKRRGRRGEGER
jgi:hypothetical protein